MFMLPGGISTRDADANPARLVESSLYDYEPDWNPPGLNVVDRPDLRMWSTSSPERGANRVAWARWSEAEAEKGIDGVLAYFHDRNRAFTWCVGPSSMSADLDLRLEVRGFVRVHVDLILTAELPVQGFRTNPHVRIEHVCDEAGVISFLRLSQASHSDWSDEEFQAAIAERLSYLRLPTGRGGMLLAYIGTEPVGNASWRFRGRTPEASRRRAVPAGPCVGRRRASPDASGAGRAMRAVET